MNKLSFENSRLSKENSYEPKINGYKRKLFYIMFFDFLGFSNDRDEYTRIIFF